jgi:hypothetical protein
MGRERMGRERMGRERMGRERMGREKMWELEVLRCRSCLEILEAEMATEPAELATRLVSLGLARTSGGRRSW